MADDSEQTLYRAVQAVIDMLWLPLNVGLTVSEVNMQEGGNGSTLLVKDTAAASFRHLAWSG